MALSCHGVKNSQDADATTPHGMHVSHGEEVFPDARFEPPKPVLCLVRSFAFTKKSSAPSFLQVAVGCY